MSTTVTLNAQIASVALPQDVDDTSDAAYGSVNVIVQPGPENAGGVQASAFVTIENVPAATCEALAPGPCTIAVTQ
jgi:hypothetical protein